MAEFQEVARHWKRMCKKFWAATSCHGCPIAEYEQAYEACSAHEADVAKMEELVMAWAAEYQEPVYETWFEYLLRIGVIPENAPAGGEYQWIVESIKHKHIPAEIAQKLGIEPKEG